MAHDSPAVVERRGKGRPKGAVNKITIALKHALENHGFDITEKLVELYRNTDDPQFRYKILRMMLDYTHPRLKDVDIVAMENGEAQPKDSTPINISLDELVAIARGDQVE